jgi:hypothetical protein
MLPILTPLLAQARSATMMPGDVVTLSWPSIFAIAGIISLALGCLVAYMRMSILITVNAQLATLEKTLVIVQRATESNTLAGDVQALVSKVEDMDKTLSSLVSDLARVDERTKQGATR